MSYITIPTTRVVSTKTHTAPPVKQAPVLPPSKSASIVQAQLQKKPAACPQQPSLIGKVTAAPYLEERISLDAVAEICGALHDLFPEEIASSYEKLLRETQNPNVKYEGWAPLHYCVYRMDSIAEGKEEYLLNVIRYLLAHGAKIDLEDARGRDPICFASSIDSELNEEFWDCLLQAGANLNPKFRDVSPLHVACSVPGKRISDFLSRGADPCSLDEFDRTPLHCAAMQGTGSVDINKVNIDQLLKVGPLATELPDSFGNYPLYYALVFSPSAIWEPILKATSVQVIEQVLNRLRQKGLPRTEEAFSQWRVLRRVRDPIYTVPPSLKAAPAIEIPYVPPSGNRIVGALEQQMQIKNFAIAGKTMRPYYGHHDGHGWVYCAFDEKAQTLFEEDRAAFVKESAITSTRFFPDVISNPAVYEEFVRKCINTWVREGADPAKTYLKCERVLGADQGRETSYVMIEGALDPRGAHVRPIYLKQ